MSYYQYRDAKDTDLAGYSAKPKSGYRIYRYGEAGYHIPVYG
jgi:hypothetical protein